MPHSSTSICQKENLDISGRVPEWYTNMYHLHIDIHRFLDSYGISVKLPRYPDFTQLNLWSSSPQLLSMEHGLVLCVLSSAPVARGRGFGKLVTCFTCRCLPNPSDWFQTKTRACKWCLDKLSTLDAFHAFFCTWQGCRRRIWLWLGAQTFPEMVES